MLLEVVGDFFATVEKDPLFPLKRTESWKWGHKERTGGGGRRKGSSEEMRMIFCTQHSYL